ncbi:MAG: 4-hydroxy-3-methylbut-2-enyl diphosphate reductase [Bacteroidales bacterium]|jgi:4-hydroxy-3-methylbut-2-enyl diphosphate reductase|nr:4-hydroxy-3-methylbut-2-enyl diphosphate reductase [Bacteroidales bacterium]
MAGKYKQTSIEIDSGSGFCFGVSRAVKLAEEQLAKGGRLISIGDIVHNEEEVERLHQKGLISSDLDKLTGPPGTPVLFRAHGEPPASYQKVKQEGRSLIDASCPVVLKLQLRINKAWKEALAANGQIVIYGKKGHPEVTGLCGYTNNRAIVVQHPEDVAQIDRDKPTALFAQTTMSYKGYEEMEALIREHLSKPDLLKVNKTICGQVANRMPNLKVFAAKHELIIFVGGNKSSNAKVLFEVCKSENPRSFFVSSLEEIDEKWLEPAVASIGICGATSTPLWLMEQVAESMRGILDKKETTI